MPDDGFTELAWQHVALRRFRLGDVPELVAYRSSPAVASARAGVCPSSLESDRKILMLVCPSAASPVISAAVLPPRPASTGCGNQSTAASTAAPAMSRTIAIVMDSPGSANVMCPIVVMPPAMAASEPDQKSSTQTCRFPRSASSAASAAQTRWTCASMPQG